MIPDEARLSGTIRSLSSEVQVWARNRIQEIATGIAKAFRTEAEVDFPFSISPMIADKDASDSAQRYMRELFGPQMIFPIPKEQIGGGSEDLAAVMEQVPGIAMFLGAGCAQEGYTDPVHSPTVRFDERALPLGTAAHAYLAIRWLQEHK